MSLLGLIGFGIRNFCFGPDFSSFGKRYSHMMQSAGIFASENIRQMKKILLFGLLAMVCSCSDNGGVQPIEEVQVKTAEVVKAKGSAGRSFPFISKPYNQTNLSFRVGGPLGMFDIQPGYFYRKGEEIASIDNRDFLIRKNRAEAVYDRAKVEFGRISSLYSKNNVSGSSYEKSKADYEVARSEYENACNELQDTELVAPFDGFVQTVYIEPFQDIRAWQPAISFIDLSRIRIETYVPEDVALKIGNGNFDKQNVEIVFDACPEKVFNPSEMHISRTTSDNNISYLMTAVMDNVDSGFVGGMSGTVSLNFSDSREGLAVPQAAICYSNHTGSMVWKIEGGKAVPVPVMMTGLENGMVSVTGRLSEGDVVAVSRQSMLSEDISVQIAE